VLFTKRNLPEGGKGPSRNADRVFSAVERRFSMADTRALKMVGIMFAALTLIVISTAAVVVTAASSVNGEYLELADVRD
jgi:hypothetical protein